MRLTDEEKRMLAGEEGEAVKLSMEVLVRIGEVYGAKRLVPIRSVHAGCAYPNFEAAVDMMERFADLGGRFRTVTTVNPNLQAGNVSRWGDLQEPETLHRAVARQNEAIERMGVIPSWSCVPYFAGNLPRVGEPVSWVESSAIVFANSVLGARTNRTTMGVDVASAITGRVPEFGLLLDENRVGNVLVHMQFQPRNRFDFNTVGYAIGKHCAGKIPVIEGLPSSTTANDLKVLGAAAATRGGIALFHAVGITPEASTRDEAFQGRKPELEWVIDEEIIKSAADELTTCTTGKVDAVLLGCPFPTVEEIKELAERLHDRHIRAGVAFCLFASSMTIGLARKMGYVDPIEAFGVRIIEDECFVSHSVREWGWRNIATNSAKCACTLAQGPTYLGVLYTDIDGCIAAAAA
jgi:predicted aconitase